MQEEQSHDPGCIYKNRLGAQGELIAKQHLIKQGLKFIKQNYRFLRAEIDLIFKDARSSTLIFVEVKMRTNKKFGEPEDSVTYHKQLQIQKAAMGFISQNSEYSNYNFRFDVISIMLENNKPVITHYQNVFC
jgi:putative endonuclease